MTLSRLVPTQTRTLPEIGRFAQLQVPALQDGHTGGFKGLPALACALNFAVQQDCLGQIRRALKEHQQKRKGHEADFPPEPRLRQISRSVHDGLDRLRRHSVAVPSTAQQPPLPAAAAAPAGKDRRHSHHKHQQDDGEQKDGVVEDADEANEIREDPRRRRSVLAIEEQAIEASMSTSEYLEQAPKDTLFGMVSRFHFQGQCGIAG